jgi:hypothetical protein
MIRFTVRDLFWLTVVAALLLGWSLDHWRALLHGLPVNRSYPVNRQLFSTLVRLRLAIHARPRLESPGGPTLREARNRKHQ